MTKIRVLAKAVLSGLVLTGMGIGLQSFRILSWPSMTSLRPGERPYAIAALPATVLAGLVLLAIFWRIVLNPQLALKLAGQERPRTVTADPSVLAGALRLAAVSAGLLLLGLFPEALFKTGHLAVDFFASGRAFFNTIAEGDYEQLPDRVLTCLQTLIYPIGLCVWIGYLLTGARWIVRRQIRSATTFLSGIDLEGSE